MDESMMVRRALTRAMPPPAPTVARFSSSRVLVRVNHRPAPDRYSPPPET